MNWAPLILDVQSTMRMGIDPNTSVLDANAESRWVRQLFVADNSALANARVARPGRTGRGGRRVGAPPRVSRFVSSSGSAVAAVCGFA